MTSHLTYISLVIIGCAAIDDLCTRKVHNSLLGILAFASLLAVIYFRNGSGLIESALIESALGFLAGFAFYLPLAWFGIVGGGDLKLLAVSGILLGPTPVIIVGFFALFWGAIMGIIQVLLNRQGIDFARNIFKIAKLQTVEKSQLHTIPFAAAIFLGALTRITWSRL